MTSPVDNHNVPAHWQQYWGPRPSVGVVVGLTLILGVFGAFIAYNESQKAQRWGMDTVVYWAAWFAVWAAEVVIALTFWLVFFAHLSQAASAVSP